MSENKNQHYVSAFYLYNFTNEEQKKVSGDKFRNTAIWHFDKNKGLIKERPIEKLAVESYLFSFQRDDGTYDHSLDDELQQVEQHAANAFKELRDIVASLHRNSSKTINIHNKIIDSIIEFIVWQIRRHPNFVNEIHQKCADLCENQNWTMSPKEMALDVISGFGRDDYSNFAKILKDKNKTIIFTTNEKKGFITTDEPFVRFNKSQSNGIKHESTEIYFPLTSNMLLYLNGHGTKNSFRVENDRKFLRSFNIYIAKKSKNYIFGETKEHLESIVRRLS